MKTMRLWVISSVAASAMALLGTAALAQTQGGAGPAAGAASAASAPGGMGMGPGMGAGRGRAAQWGTNYTPGWSMMTTTERNEHRARMRSMKTYEECKTYMDEHHALMMERVKEKGGKPLAQPRRDACAGLKP